MKNTLQLRHRALLFAFGVVIFSTLNPQLSTVLAQSTAFTYQGRLNDGDSPANGSYDLTFSQFDSDTDGNQVGSSLTNAAVDVSNGLFVVTLDFGAGIFDGTARWLEIGVRTNETGDFAVLIPRQAVTPTPYAIYAANAASAASVVAGAVASDQLSTLAAPTDGQVLAWTAGSLLWTDPVAGGSVWSLNGAKTYYNSGNVGIGTSNPQENLTIAGVTSFNTGLKLTGSASGGTGLALENTSSGGHKFDVLSGGASDGIGAGAFGIYDETMGSYRLSISSGGNVGIGTATPATKLTVRTGNSVFTGYGFEHTDGTVRLTTFIDAGYGAWLGTRSNHPLNFFYNDGLPSMTIGGGGIEMVSGLGTVTVGSPNAESGTSIKRDSNRADVRFNGSTLKLVAASGVGPPPSEYGVAITTAGNVGIGTTSPAAKLDVIGTTRTCVLTITGGCDLAEPFLMKEGEIAKGSVVVIDDAHPGQLKLSTEAYDTRVAGIVSGANGINPGISLQQEGVLAGGQNVALSGRVYVQADAAFGAIKAGDLLTTSNTPGHAMKVTNHAKAQGAILGKAMSLLEEGKGMVLVLVTLQ
jgi:hypothetical protein